MSDFVVTKDYDAGEVGFNATAINSAADGNWIQCGGFNQMTAQIFYDRSAGTGIEFYITSRGIEDNTKAHYRVFEEDGGSASGVQTVNLNRKKYVRTISADDYFEINIPLATDEVRFEDVLSTGTPDASDKATIWVRFSRV